MRAGGQRVAPDRIGGLRRASPHDSGWIGVAITIAGIGLTIALVFLVAPLREATFSALQGDTEALRRELLGLGVGGAIVLLALILVHAVVFYPSEIVNAAAGFVYGFWLALPMVMVGWLLSALASYWIGRAAGRPLLYRLVGERRFCQAERIVQRGGVTMLLAARLIPIMPYSLVGYVAGAARLPLGRFTWTSVVGYLPMVAAFVYVGTAIERISILDPRLWIAAVALLALLAAGHFAGRRLREQGPEQAGRPG